MCICRYGEDLTPQSVMFIDFQLVTKVSVLLLWILFNRSFVRASSLFQVCPAIDVAYFLAPSTTGEVTACLNTL